MVRPHNLEDKMGLSACVFKILYLVRPLVCFHIHIIDYVIDFVNYILMENREEAPAPEWMAAVRPHMAGRDRRRPFFVTLPGYTGFHPEIKHVSAVPGPEKYVLMIDVESATISV